MGSQNDRAKNHAKQGQILRHLQAWSKLKNTTKAMAQRKGGFFFS
jgi:hypothetical protein